MIENLLNKRFYKFIKRIENNMKNFQGEQQVERRSQVMDEIDVLISSMDTLGSLLQTMEKRLEKVLVSEGLVGLSTATEDSIPLVPMAMLIKGRRLEIEQYNRTINSILSRLEL